MANEFAAFVAQLASTSVPDRVFSPFAWDYGPNAVRRRNLELYLEQMRARRPTALLLAEAPGYRGMRLTGVPFCSQSILRSGLDPSGMFGEHRGYRVTAEAPQFQGEQSATIVWSTIAQYEPLPLLWGAFPFHPHRAGQPWTNRPPTQAELEIGRPFVVELLRLFQPERVIAIGNHAHGSLAKLGYAVPKVRHPAQGGKHEFVAGLARELGCA